MPKPVKRTARATVVGASNTGTKRFLDRLLSERRGLAADLPRVRQLAEMFPRSEVIDPEDLSVQETDRDVTLNILDRRSNRLMLIDAALKRVAEGTYGQCIECDAQIAQARLGADPAVPLCIDCQRRLEERGPLRLLDL